MKKLATLLTLILCLSMTQINTFAAETPDTPELVKHTETVVVEPGENIIQPRMWAQDGGESRLQYLYLVPFVIPDRYFAYEVSATGASGQYTAALMYDNFIVAATYGRVGAGTYKNDWIEVDPGETYQFKISNFTGGTITVNLTYYSWK